MSEDHRKYYKVRRSRTPVIEERSPEIYNLVSPGRRRRTIIIKESTRSSGRPGRRRIESSPSPTPPPQSERRRRSSSDLSPRIITRSPSPVTRRPRRPTPPPSPPYTSNPRSPRIHQRPIPMSPPPLTQEGQYVPLPPKIKRRSKTSHGEYTPDSDAPPVGYRHSRNSSGAAGIGYEYIGTGPPSSRGEHFPERDLDRPRFTGDQSFPNVIQRQPQDVIDVLVRKTQEQDAVINGLTRQINDLHIRQRAANRQNEEYAGLEAQVRILEQRLRQQQSARRPRTPGTTDLSHAQPFGVPSMPNASLDAIRQAQQDYVFNEPRRRPHDRRRHG